jgi:hypothetical protein
MVMSIYNEDGTEKTFTEAFIKQMIENHETLHELADRRADQYLFAVGQKTDSTIEITFDADSYTFFHDDGRIDAYYVKYEAFWAYGGHEIYGHYVPLSMLWAPEETIAHAKEMMEKETQRLEAIEAAAEKDRKKKREQHDRAEFRRLQKKYGSKE